jgi:hypothetical protein
MPTKETTARKPGRCTGFENGKCGSDRLAHRHPSPESRKASIQIAEARPDRGCARRSAIRKALIAGVASSLRADHRDAYIGDCFHQPVARSIACRPSAQRGMLRAKPAAGRGGLGIWKEWEECGLPDGTGRPATVRETSVVLNKQGMEVMLC